jgi:hypothetical protein
MLSSASIRADISQFNSVRRPADDDSSLRGTARSGAKQALRYRVIHEADDSAVRGINAVTPSTWMPGSEHADHLVQSACVGKHRELLHGWALLNRFDFIITDSAKRV